MISSYFASILSIQIDLWVAKALFAYFKYKNNPTSALILFSKILLLKGILAPIVLICD